MTREEAIEFGKMWLELQEDCKDSNTYDFFKMAIEALQQEPTYTSEVAQKAYEDGKKDGYMQRKIETISVKKQEPKRGRWIMTGDYFTGAYESIDYVKCSCCGEESLEEGNYCPNCGADMREEQK